MLFTADQNGYISGVRFYKGSSNTGTHVGSLWTSTGTLLAQATFTNETASGWQQVLFSTPVAITANTVYVVSYHSPEFFSYDPSYFYAAVDNPPLHAVRAASGNGAFQYGASSVFPSTWAAGANFWVDVVFTLPAQHQAALSWTPGDSQVAGYNVYRTTQSGGTFSLLNSGVIASTSFTDGSVAAGQTYVYVATTIAASGLESLASNQVVAVIPSP